MLARWDAIGITHELNGYRNDAAGWLKKYGDERELQIGALNRPENGRFMTFCVEPKRPSP